MNQGKICISVENKSFSCVVANENGISFSELYYFNTDIGKEIFVLGCKKLLHDHNNYICYPDMKVDPGYFLLARGILELFCNSINSF